MVPPSTLHNPIDLPRAAIPILISLTKHVFHWVGDGKEQGSEPAPVGYELMIGMM